MHGTPVLWDGNDVFLFSVYANGELHMDKPGSPDYRTRAEVLELCHDNWENWYHMGDVPDVTDKKDAYDLEPISQDIDELLLVTIVRPAPGRDELVLRENVAPVAPSSPRPSNTPNS